MTATSDMSGTSWNSSGVHANPHRTFLQTITPRRLKELFLWTEYLFYNSAHVYAALRKFGEYPITEVIYNTTNKSLRKKHKHLLENVIRVRELLIMATLDKYVYGNAFVSMYQPFIRYLKCPHCTTLTNIQHIDYVFNLSKLTFTYTCGNCDAKVTAGESEVQDRKVMLAKQVNFIRWDPKLMDIDYNPMTGTSIYYYKIPQDVIQRVQQGHKALIDTLPLGFISAIKENKKFKFAKDAIFHIKTAGPAGVNPQWGLPPLISAIQLFHFTAVLRKANECISLSSLVETPEGLLLADNVQVGDLVRTDTGEWQSVEKKWYRDARKDEIGIKISVAGARGLGQVYSPDHPIMVLRHKNPKPLNLKEGRYYGGSRQPPNKILKHAHLYEEFGGPASQIVLGDYILYPRKLPTVTEQEFNIAKYNPKCFASNTYVYNFARKETAEAFEALEKGEKIPYSISVKIARRTLKQGKTLLRFPAKLPITPELAYILGWYAGDGSCNQRNVIFSLGGKDNTKPLFAAIKKVFGIKARSNFNKWKTLNTVTIGNVQVRNFIKGIIPGTARDKKAPPEILNAPDDTKLAYLKGLWDADGYIEGDLRAILATSSINQAYDSYRILLHLGCIATITKTTIKDSSFTDRVGNLRTIRGGIHYPVKITKASTRRLIALWKGKKAPKVITGKSGLIWKDYFATRVYAIEESEEARYLDFKVTRGSSFSTLSLCCHNSIGLDHLVPWRILSPAAQTQQADPATTISLQNWTTKMDWHLKKYRQDPLHIMYAPIPVNVSQIGGQGRALLTLGEIQEAEKSIVAALGVPMEFLYGGLTRGGMEITLRLIENQLETHINDIKDLLQWVDDNCAKFLGWERITVDMKPFRMVDDVLQKQTLMQMWMQGQQTGAPIVSDQTIAELNQVDLRKEESRIKQETLDRIRQQQEVQLEINKIQNNMATQVMLDAQQASGGSGYNPLQVIADADAIVGRITQLDEGSKKSELHTLQMEDYVLYAVVVQRLEHFHTTQQPTATGPTG
jgi:hypothetical protein